MSIISKKNQITLPVETLRRAGMKPGDDVRITAVGPGKVEILSVDELIDRYSGIFGKDVYPDGYLEELRAEWD
ncbi:MAG: hypothetical protein AB7V42_05735 [Thermoleophilia bacterium]